MSILVIGSFMMDLVVKTPRVPENGETIIGKALLRFPGGKGANQAVAAARLSGNVTMAGMVGVDQFGNEAINVLNHEKVNSNYIQRDLENSTGVGLVMVEANGNNRIVVIPGANLSFKAKDLDQIRGMINDFDIVLMQLEMDLEMIEKAVTYADDARVPIILNPAPAQKLSDDLLKKITYLTPNETEAEILTGIKIHTKEDAEKAGRSLLEKGVQHVIITLGEKGALIVDESGTTYVPGFPVTPYDTVAAGDAFNGALSVGITGGKSLVDAVKHANAVGALAVTKQGAIPSLPHVEEVEEFIKSKEVLQ
ncbi:ribokinase [Pseudalkalibacillus sp. R45]|uniref:ribokinase n=1 Tax=Pseudalkalibacillus sp. R45 TaxID=3457433 RepID=UPI003FCCAF27